MSAGLGQPFESRRDIYAIAVDVLAFNDYVAQIDANAKIEPSVIGFIGT